MVARGRLTHVANLADGLTATEAHGHAVVGSERSASAERHHNRDDRDVVVWHLPNNL